MNKQNEEETETGLENKLMIASGVGLGEWVKRKKNQCVFFSKLFISA